MHTLNTQQALKEFRGPAGDDENIACAFGEFLGDTQDCSAAAATLNDMTDAFANGGFQTCIVTTPTTTPTSTTTTTPTTTPTTTLYASPLTCVSQFSANFFGGDGCALDAIYLNRVLDTCPFGAKNSLECKST